MHPRGQVLYLLWVHNESPEYDSPERNEAHVDHGWRPHAAGLWLWLMLTYWSWVTGAGWWAGSNNRAAGMLYPTPGQAAMLLLLTVLLQFSAWLFFALCGFPNILSHVAAIAMLSVVFFVNSRERLPPPAALAPSRTLRSAARAVPPPLGRHRCNRHVTV